MEFRKIYERQQKKHKCIEQSLDSVGEDQGGMIWENGIVACILSCKKRITSLGSIQDTGYRMLGAGALG